MNRYHTLTVGFAVIVIVLSAGTPAIGQACTLSASSGSAAVPCSRVLRTSGQQWMDQGFLREIYYLDKILGVNPSFRMCEEVRGPNAFASPEVIDPAYPDGTVFFGSALARGELTQTGLANNFSIPAIMAHEFGHILQFKQGVRLPTKLKELQADYIAGWFMGNRDRFSGWSVQSFRNTLQSFYEKGDYAFNSPTHHGTPSERADAITRGFESANMPLAVVFQQSYAYVSQLGNATDSSIPSNHPSSVMIPEHTNNSNSNSGPLAQIFQELINSKGDFSRFKGQRDPDGDGSEWVSTLSVPGAVSCTVSIENGSGQSFSCNMAELTDPSEANSAFERLVSSITQALPSDWRRRDVNSTGKYVHRNVRFERSSRDPWISVELRGSRRIVADFTVFSPD